jgi:hypothetical protein
MDFLIPRKLFKTVKNFFSDLLEDILDAIPTEGNVQNKLLLFHDYHSQMMNISSIVGKNHPTGDFRHN